MSCEIAASIIAGMRGYGDEDRVKQELGCEQGKKCNVKNIEILRFIM
jgi:hypothetical protein